jgi:hypothetical protein
MSSSRVNFIFYVVAKGEAIPLQVWIVPREFNRMKLPEFLDIRHMKVVMLSALRTDSLDPPKRSLY